MAETVFEEDFDGTLVGWFESLCDTAGPPAQTEQICLIDQTTALFDFPNEAPNSLPNWGFVEIDDTGGTVGGFDIPIEVRYQKNFNVANEGIYAVSAWLGIKDCSACNISTQLYIDGILVLEKIGPNINDFPPGPHKFFEQSTIHLTSGSHNVEMAMQSTGAVFGHFRASFDDIKIVLISPELSCGPKTILNEQNQCIPDLSQVCGQGTFPDFDALMCFGLTMNAVGGELLEINSIPLLLGSIGTNPIIAGMFAVTVAGIVGQAVWFVHKRKKSKNS